MKQNPLYKFLSDVDTILAAVIFAVALFFSYSSWVAPEFRNELVFSLLALGLVVGTGVRAALLAWAKSHADTVATLANQGINAAEKAVGRNVVPDDVQLLVINTLRSELKDLNVSPEVAAKLSDVENKIRNLLRQ